MGVWWRSREACGPSDKVKKNCEPTAGPLWKGELLEGPTSEIVPRELCLIVVGQSPFIRRLGKPGADSVKLRSKRFMGQLTDHTAPARIARVTKCQNAGNVCNNNSDGAI